MPTSSDPPPTHAPLTLHPRTHPQFPEDQEHKRLEEAVELYEDAIRIRADLMGAHHEDTVLSTNNLAVVLQRLNRVDEAEEVLQSSLDAMKVRVMPGAVWVSVYRSRSLAVCYRIVWARAPHPRRRAIPATNQR